jgi:hypothetical protein
MESSEPAKASLREKALEELTEFIVLSAYLYVCFAAVICFKAAVLHAHEIAYAPLGLAIHGRTIWESLDEIAGGTFQQVAATIFIIFLILFPYFAFRSLGNIVGDKILVRLFFERRHSR